MPSDAFGRRWIMPRTKRPESVRLNLEIAPAVRDRLERLRDETEAESLTEVIRRALAVYQVLVEESRGTKEIIIRSKDGSEQTLLLVP
jgi:hypothetical protein